MSRTHRGFQLLELTLVLALLGIVTAMGLPSLLSLSARQRVRLAAGELVGVLHLARSHALRSNTHVGVKFRPRRDGEVTFTLYADGDGDGVRSRDIAAGIDPPVGSERILQHFGGGVGFHILGPPPPRDPGNPRRRLRRLRDPIRFNRSDIASFGPLGTATPGSLYVSDGKEQQAVVRVLGLTGRVRVLVYDRASERWRRH